MSTTAERKPQPEHWHRLDNTANLFPVITSKKAANVYRLSLNLAQPVQPEILQAALEDILPDFSAFRVRLRRGVFWHYLEHNPKTPVAHAEDEYPLRAVVAKQNNNFLFRVTYHDCRVNLEVFHALTDGTGGMQFLRALCCRYLIMAYPGAFSPEDAQRRWLAEHAGDTEDGYVAHYTPTKKATYRVGRGFRLKGERSMLDFLSVVHAYIPVKPLLEYCRGKGVSITHYLVACIAYGIYTQQMKKSPPKNPLNIFVPVNLRNLFPSTTMLNFFASVLISLPFSQAGEITFDDVLAQVNTQFEEKLTQDAILEKISYTVGSGYSPLVRILPLPLKWLGLKFIYESSVKSNSISFSNIGPVTMPEPFAPYVTGASLMLSSTTREPFKCTACSHGELLCFTLTSSLRSMALQRDIIRTITAGGLPVTIETNGVDYENM